MLFITRSGIADMCYSSIKMIYVWIFFSVQCDIRSDNTSSYFNDLGKVYNKCIELSQYIGI